MRGEQTHSGEASHVVVVFDVIELVRLEAVCLLLVAAVNGDTEVVDSVGLAGHGGCYTPPHNTT